MSSGMKKFLILSLSLIAVLAAIVLFNLWVYKTSVMEFFQLMLFVITTVLLIVVAILVISIICAIYVYRKKRSNDFCNLFIGIIKRVLIPFAVFIAGITGKDKDEIRRVYVELNNIVVRSQNRHYKGTEVLVLLPHCLQNSDCNIKITQSTDLCKRCGKCDILDLLKLSEKYGCSIAVVTGGTAARNAIVSMKPSVVLSVACERDLVSGISDVNSIPVIGVLNERPNGPCKDTRVNMTLVEENLRELLNLSIGHNR